MFIKPVFEETDNWLDFYGEASGSHCGFICGLDWQQKEEGWMDIIFVKPNENETDNWLDFYGEASGGHCGFICGLDWQ